MELMLIDSCSKIFSKTAWDIDLKIVMDKVRVYLRLYRKFEWIKLNG